MRFGKHSATPAHPRRGALSTIARRQIRSHVPTTCLIHHWVAKKFSPLPAQYQTKQGEPEESFSFLSEWITSMKTFPTKAAVPWQSAMKSTARRRGPVVRIDGPHLLSNEFSRRTLLKKSSLILQQPMEAPAAVALQLSAYLRKFRSAPRLPHRPSPGLCWQPLQNRLFRPQP